MWIFLLLQLCNRFSISTHSRTSCTWFSATNFLLFFFFFSFYYLAHYWPSDQPPRSCSLVGRVGNKKVSYLNYISEHKLLVSPFTNRSSHLQLLSPHGGISCPSPAVPGQVDLFYIDFDFTNELINCKKHLHPFKLCHRGPFSLLNIIFSVSICRFWTHLIMAYAFSFWTCYLLYKEYDIVASMRLHFLASERRRPDQFTVSLIVVFIIISLQQDDYHHLFFFLKYWDGNGKWQV